MFKEDLLKGKESYHWRGSGLGKEMTRYFLIWCRVLICGRRFGVLEYSKELMDEQGGSVKCYGLDVEVSDVDNTISEIFKDAPIHGLVNNAG